MENGISSHQLPKGELTLTHIQMLCENIVAKAEIAHDEQFLHLSQCLQLYLITRECFFEKVLFSPLVWS